MLSFFYNKLHNTRPLVILAFTLVLPVYSITIFGMAPIIQGLSYSIYLLCFLYTWLLNKQLFLPKKFIIFWFVFLLTWILPNLFNANSGRLESDLLNLNVLYVHVVYLTALLFSFLFYMQSEYFLKFKKFYIALMLLLLPLLTALFLKTIFLEFENPKMRYSPYGATPHWIGELLLVFALVLFYLKNNFLKFILYFTVFFYFHLLEVRAGIIALALALGIMYSSHIYTYLKQKSFLFLSIFFFLLASLLILFKKYLYIAFDSIFYFSTPSRSLPGGISGRFHQWQNAIEVIKEHPVSGIGYWVNPFPYEYYNIMVGHPTHNAWLRIASENGFCLALICISIVLLGLYLAYKKKLFFELACLVSIIFYLSFTTRHLSINIMNAFFYFILLRIYFFKSSK